MSSDFMLAVVLSDCKRLSGLANLHHLGELLVQHGFNMIIFPKVGEEGVVLRGTQVGAYLNQTVPGELQEAALMLKHRYPASFGRRLLTEEAAKQGWGFGLSYKDGHVDVLVDSPLLDLESPEHCTLVEPCAQRLRALAHAMYAELQPAVASVDKPGQGHNLFTDVLKRRLKYINWVNIFGLPYVQKYGRDFLLGLPGYKVEELSDGSIYHQLSPTFLVEEPKSARALRQQVVTYCARADLKVVCKAPYHLPGVSSSPEPPPEDAISDEAVRAYMQEILSRTLVLTDGTRLKPIPVAWHMLTPTQEQIAVEMIKAAAVAEIRQHRDKRIRFEFNALPTALETMMADLVGRENPDFEWVQVEMGLSSVEGTF